MGTPMVATAGPGEIIRSHGAHHATKHSLGSRPPPTVVPLIRKGLENDLAIVRHSLDSCLKIGLTITIDARFQEASATDARASIRELPNELPSGQDLARKRRLRPWEHAEAER